MREYRIKRGHNQDINSLISNYYGANGDVFKGIEIYISNPRIEFDHWFVYGTARNTGTEYLNRASITVNFYNSAGAWLAKRTDSAYDIASGYSWNFEVTYDGKYENDVASFDFDFGT